MNPQKATRKHARTAIYRALYGEQAWDPNSHARRPNLPWLDPTRSRPEDWSSQNALPTIEHHWKDAQFDDFRKKIIASDLGVNNIANEDIFGFRPQ